MNNESPYKVGIVGERIRLQRTSICGATAGENAPEVYRDPVSRNRIQAQHKRPRLLRRLDGDLKARGRIAMDGLHTRKPYNQSPVAW
ncbi:hypothetical protein PoB_001004200 [Plakobranchus ocellatus]|uniref:Uncharacterized protein n=1 Tax=Plakobranchus ocellatus TaxID=259542 RepID=A0AAV3YKU6_9GAST|nr:hypothetical protein PoB_001004200 [Plakobranchus ocellatus]